MISIVGLPARRIRDKDGGLTFVLEKVSSMSVWDKSGRNDANSATPHLTVHFVGGSVSSELLEFLRPEEIPVQVESSATIMSAKPLGLGNVEVWLSRESFEQTLQDFELAFAGEQIFVGLSWSGESYSNLEKFSSWMICQGDAPEEFWLSIAPEIQLLRRHS